MCPSHVPPHPFPRRLRSLPSLVPRFGKDQPLSLKDRFPGPVSWRRFCATGSPAANFRRRHHQYQSLYLKLVNVDLYPNGYLTYYPLERTQDYDTISLQTQLKLTRH